MLQSRLYKDSLQGKRVMAIAQRALANNAGRPVTSSNGYIHIAPETLAGMWAMQNFLLHQQAQALIAEPCRQHGIAIQMLGEYPLFSGLKLVRGQISDVIIVPAEQDPLIATGKFPLPKAVRDKLHAMEKAGVPCDLLHTYIAHEVPNGSVDPAGPIPLEVIVPPVPAHVTRTSRRLGVVAHAATVRLLRGMRHTAGKGLLGIGVATMATGAASALLLDPLIFGALADERGMATWFVLAQWVW